MLKLKTNCECCNKTLLPTSTDAMICSYECTFCKTCVETVLLNVCPNCGGGFSPRPIRPKLARREGVSLKHQPASKNKVHTLYSIEEIEQFAKAYCAIPAAER